MHQNRFNKSFLTSLLYYLETGYKKDYRRWRWLISYYMIVIISACIAIALLITLLQVFPPKTTTIASGQRDSTTLKMSESFQKSFASFGLNLSAVVGEGKQEGVERLKQQASPVNASFYIAGQIDPIDYPNIVSMGAVGSAPLWLFYRGSAIDSDHPMDVIKNKRVAIGLPGTATNNMFRKLFHEIDGPFSGKTILEEISYEDAEKGISDGIIDAVFIVHSFNTPIVQRLIKNPKINIFDFKLADAYIKKYPNLEKVLIPRGAIDLNKILPKKDVTLLSASIILLVENQIHPAIQWAFVFAAKQFNRTENDFFSKPGEYPRDVDYDLFPLSEVAKRYYEGGVPQVFDNFPIWIASLIDQLWIKVIAFFVIIYPVLINILNVRLFVSSKIKNQAFAYLRYLKIKGINSNSVDQLMPIINQIDQIIGKVSSIGCNIEDAKDYIELVYLARDVKAELEGRLQELGGAV